MHRKCSPNTQFPLISSLNDLSEKQRKRLDASWAAVFYREIYCRLKEEPFAVVYSDCPSRPNYPVRVLVALEFLKAGNGWTDEVMYDLSLIHISEPTRLGMISYAVFCLKKK